jgi:hypothetical protein
MQEEGNPTKVPFILPAIWNIVVFYNYLKLCKRVDGILGAKQNAFSG